MSVFVGLNKRALQPHTQDILEQEPSSSSKKKVRRNPSFHQHPQSLGRYSISDALMSAWAFHAAAMPEQTPRLNQDSEFEKKTQAEQQGEELRPKIYKRLLFFYNLAVKTLNMKLVVFSLRKAHEIRTRIKLMRECTALLYGGQIKHEDKQPAACGGFRFVTSFAPSISRRQYGRSPLSGNTENSRKPSHSEQGKSKGSKDALEKPARFLSRVNRGIEIRQFRPRKNQRGQLRDLGPRLQEMRVPKNKLMHLLRAVYRMKYKGGVSHTKHRKNIVYVKTKISHSLFFPAPNLRCSPIPLSPDRNMLPFGNNFSSEDIKFQALITLES